jgi:multidrug resistance efflux pump
MNALNMTSLKILACAAVAIALTATMSWTFVESTDVVRTTFVLAKAAGTVSGHLAEAAVTGLLQ